MLALGVCVIAIWVRRRRADAWNREQQTMRQQEALKIESVDFSDNVEENAPDVPAETSRQDVPAETSGQESAGAVERWQAKEERRKRREARAKRKALYARERRSRVFGLNSEAHVQDAEQALQTMIRSSLKGLTSYDAGTLTFSNLDVCFLLPQQRVRINAYPLRCSFTAGLRAFQAVVHVILGL